MARRTTTAGRTKARKSKPAKSARRTARSIRAASVPKAAPPPAQPITSFSAMTSAVPHSTGGKAINTVVYVHGIGNKPPASTLKCQWDTALFGKALGDRTRMAYWVNREIYPVPTNETCADGDKVNTTGDVADVGAFGIRAASVGGTSALSLQSEAALLTSDPKRQAWLARVGAKMLASTEVTPAEIRTRSVRAKILPVPEFLRKLIAANLTKIFLRDVNDFLFVKERRDDMEQALLDRLQAGGGPFAVIAHSQGSMIAYDVLRRLDPAKFEIPLFVTIGSPLGLQEVQDVLRQWTGGTLPFPPCVKRWVNVAERLDPVALDNDISNDFEGKIENESGLFLNPDSPRHPHSATGYLSTKFVRDAVRNAVGTAFHQVIGPFSIARNLASDLEDSHRVDRHPTLIQLSDDRPKEPLTARELDTLARGVELKIREATELAGTDFDAVEIDRLRHFVSAKLTRFEVECLRSAHRDLKIANIWKNSRKRALIMDSTHTLQVRPANLGYGADGKKICWAVLDTGIRADHPHFAKHKNIIGQFDCTRRGEPKNFTPRDPEFATLDRDGHGTHVAATIGGEYTFRDETSAAGMAPRTQIFGFKVLNDEGEGEDAWIIKGLDTIARMNERAGSLVVQGVNLSLGGNFDPEMYGCGHTPLCQELRRLWRQGVVVCLAAGNEGYVVLKSEGGNVQANLDLTIGDPANLEEAIAIGSVHKTNPHTYGISYFSSRGPTADGRRKPDVVAPGERIMSARHDWRHKDNPEFGDLYVEMSGTSMAAPHVSGMLASFLSLRREFIGYPDRVKAMLLGSCVDLGRDPYMQGAGLPNLIKMLALN
jgi:subtilisin family serine protease